MRDCTRQIRGLEVAAAARLEAPSPVAWRDVYRRLADAAGACGQAALFVPALAPS